MVKPGETIVFSMLIEFPTIYDFKIEIFDPSDVQEATLTPSDGYSITPTDDEKYEIKVLWNLPSDAVTGTWRAEISIYPSADTCSKETVTFDVG